MGSHVRFKSKLGALIHEARAKHKLSQREVSVLLGMKDEGHYLVSAWERGWRPVRVEESSRSSLAELLGIKLPELDVLLRDDETARARAITRRRAGQAVRRQYEVPTPAAPVAKPPVVTPAAAAPERRPVARAPENVRVVPPKTDAVSTLVTALVAGDPDLAGANTEAIVGLVRRFLSIQKALVASASTL